MAKDTRIHETRPYFKRSGALAHRKPGRGASRGAGAHGAPVNAGLDGRSARRRSPGLAKTQAQKAGVTLAAPGSAEREQAPERDREHCENPNDETLLNFAARLIRPPDHDFHALPNGKPRAAERDDIDSQNAQTQQKLDPQEPGIKAVGNRWV